MISQRDMTKGKVLISASAIIEGKGREILLIWEGDMPYHKWWVIPGGYVNPEETVKEAVVREVREETGLRVNPTKLIGVYDDLIPDKDCPLHHVIVAYTTEVVGGRIVFSQEARAYKWMSLDEALNSPEIPTVFKKILDDFKNSSPTLISRLKKFATYEETKETSR
jgi:8-oxo-dGTP diphosphatase